MVKKILVLGATGSIGTQTLDVVRRFPDRLQVVGMTTHRHNQELAKFGVEFGCGKLLITGRFPTAMRTELLREFIAESGADLAVNGVAGAAGLMPSVFALESGMDLALANKETIVMAGPLVLDLAAKQGRKVIPVDSEHSAVFHLLRRSSAEAAEIILTASGGPFRTLDKAKFTEIRAADALKHPTWNMGAKITIDSATLANKGLEVIEARYLFGMEPDKIKVLVHPQSIVHSLIRTVDGVLYAQLSRPDMRHPLMNALLFPETVSNDLEILDLAGQELTFFPPRFDDFPLLGLAYRAAEAGLGSCIAYNAANEIAVQAFLQGRIRFTDFASLVGAALDAAATDRPETIGEVLALDAKYRSVTV